LKISFGGNNLLDKLQNFYKKNKTLDDCFPSLNNYGSFFSSEKKLLELQKFKTKINKKGVKLMKLVRGWGK